MPGKYFILYMRVVCLIVYIPVRSSLNDSYRLNCSSQYCTAGEAVKACLTSSAMSLRQHHWAQGSQPGSSHHLSSPFQKSSRTTGKKWMPQHEAKFLFCDPHTLMLSQRWGILFMARALKNNNNKNSHCRKKPLLRGLQFGFWTKM